MNRIASFLKISGKSMLFARALWFCCSVFCLHSTAIAETPAAPLNGKIIYVNSGHGWYWNGADWQTSRGNTWGLVEDFFTAEFVNQFVVEHLSNAGAEVRTLREMDMNSAMVIVDDADGGYVEIGDVGLFSDAGTDGFSNFSAPYTSGINPFRDTGGGARSISVAATSTATATWSPTLPEAGYYQVYISFPADPLNGVEDAHYVVQHSGGETHFKIDQTRNGWTWVRLGRFHFEAGIGTGQASVTLHSDSSGVPGTRVFADAVRFGGGQGDVSYSNQTSGRPRWEESAQTFAQFMGAPPEAYEGSSVTAIPRFASWQNQPDDDSMYISLHTNAPNPGRGTVSYVYGPNPPDGSYDPSLAVAGSTELMNLVHDEIVSDIRAGWDADWNDHGYASAYFSELNPNYNAEMPSAQFSIAFHATEADAQQLKEPRFLNLVARAIAQGVVKYIADRDGGAVNLYPDPPQNPEVHITGAGSFLVSWKAPEAGNDLAGDPAEDYSVELSKNGYSFDEGIKTPATQLEITGLEPDQIYYLRIRALNGGGRSLATETLAIRTLGSDVKRVLLVQAYDRIDRSILPKEYVSAELGTVDRVSPERMNRFNYVIEHAEAFRPYPVAFDSTSNEAFGDGSVTPDPDIHQAIIWMTGRESTADETVSDQERAILSTYLDSGGDLLVSGSDLAWDLDSRGTAEEQAFIRNHLGASYGVDDAGVNQVTAIAGSIFDGIDEFMFDDGNGKSYAVDFPDGLIPEAGSEACMKYTGSAHFACVFSINGDSKVIYLGFPFETINSASVRSQVMGRIFSVLDIRPEIIFVDGFE